MSIILIGANHTSSSLEQREGLNRLISSFATTTHFPYPHVSLLTCNRCEIYIAADHTTQAHLKLLALIRESGIADFEESLYTLFDTDALRHLSSVASGLQSALFGETEIQGQVRTAYEEARIHRTLPKELHSLFQQALRISKKIRNTYFNHHSYCQIETLLEQKIQERSLKKGLFIGASSINRKIATYLSAKVNYSITLCNRTDAKAKALADDLSAKVLPWNELHVALDDFDWIISGVKSPSYILDSQSVRTLKNPLIIDLGVPRNIDPLLCQGKENLFHIEQLTSTISPVATILKSASEMIDSQCKQVRASRQSSLQSSFEYSCYA